MVYNYGVSRDRMLELVPPCIACTTVQMEITALYCFLRCLLPFESVILLVFNIAYLLLANLSLMQMLLIYFVGKKLNLVS